MLLPISTVGMRTISEIGTNACTSLLFTSTLTVKWKVGASISPHPSVPNFQRHLPSRCSGSIISLWIPFMRNVVRKGGFAIIRPTPSRLSSRLKRRGEWAKEMAGGEAAAREAASFRASNLPDWVVSMGSFLLKTGGRAADKTRKDFATRHGAAIGENEVFILAGRSEQCASGLAI